MKVIFLTDGFHLDRELQLSVQKKLLLKLGNNKKLIEDNGGIIKVHCEPNEQFTIEIEGVPEKITNKILLDWEAIDNA